MRAFLGHLLRGLAMGSADAVPGISGGTVALLLGFYGRLLAGLAAWIAFPSRVRTEEGRAELRAAALFLVPLALGLLAAYWTATRLLVGATESPGLLRRPGSAPILYGFFTGLVVASAWKVWIRVPRPGGREWSLATLGVVAAFLFVGLPQLQGEPPTWALLPGGAAAISVMLLPGVSGSLLLVVLGQYTVVSAAVHDRDLAVLAVFGAGLVLGASLFVPWLRRLLDRAPRPTLAGLTGLMLGSTRALWPWKDNYDPKAGELGNHLRVLDGGVGTLLAVVAAAAAGVAAVALLEWLERRAARRAAVDEEGSAVALAGPNP